MASMLVTSCTTVWVWSTATTAAAAAAGVVVAWRVL